MATTAPAKAPKRSISRWRIWSRLLLVLAVLTALMMAYLWITLNWNYSEGERAGILQKFSRRGWVCKTYEGELAMSIVPGVTPTIWNFTVRDAGVAQRMDQAIGKRVVLHYTEHKGIPSECFGETSYFVDSVRIVE
jgi:hypothetical protein